jgi:hypothetical protein
MPSSDPASLADSILRQALPPCDDDYRGCCSLSAASSANKAKAKALQKAMKHLEGDASDEARRTRGQLASLLAKATAGK